MADYYIFFVWYWKELVGLLMESDDDDDDDSPMVAVV